MKKNGEIRLKDKYDKAIILYMRGVLQKDIALTLDVSVNTVSKWLKELKDITYKKQLVKYYKLQQKMLNSSEPDINKLKIIHDIIADIEKKTIFF